MGEYAQRYAMQHHGIDIYEPGDSPRKPWKWQCSACGKKMASQSANEQHMKAKHPKASIAAKGGEHAKSE